MPGELKNIKLGEVSLVDKPANKRPFLFFKRDIEKKKLTIGIVSDGTKGGTEITLNGDIVKDLNSFHFGFYPGMDGDDGKDNAISCSYSKVVETDDGFKRSETFYLSKGEFAMNKEIEKQLKAYFGEDAEIDFEKMEANDPKAISEALVTINEYREDFPGELKKAIGLIAKQSGFCDVIVSKILEQKKKSNDKDGENKDIEKAGAKFSKETLEKLESVIKAIEALKKILPALTDATEKSADSGDKNKGDTDETKAAMEKLTKAIEGIHKPDKNKDEDEKSDLAKAVEKITERLGVVEKGTGVAKKIDGQEDTDNSGKKWPSIAVD